MLSLALNIVGAIAIIFSVIAGIFTGTLSGFFIFSFGGVCIAMVLFAFAQIIDNQLNILHQLQVQNEFAKQHYKALIDCSNCDYEYDDSLSSCPHCGHRRGH
ncbi:hypothetical protein [Bacillus suaedae]|uniref:Uncharacterized protein n=1 Tax=Halalkalibacter suaedae TaxID=2822140 RepID=A0A940WZP9_9BACI|nr:hypothetical protein [Bacillus suaedae]MBP3951741.1 hypothetical protein [Bacillus suaedae]